MNQELGKKLLSILKEEQVKKDEPMKSHTTFRVGGPADYFVTPQTAEEVAFFQPLLYHTEFSVQKILTCKQS